MLPVWLVFFGQALWTSLPNAVRLLLTGSFILDALLFSVVKLVGRGLTPNWPI